MARMPGTAPRTADQPASKSERNVGFGGVRLRRRRLAKPEARTPTAMREHGARRNQEGGLHAEHPAEHQEDDGADAHLERDGSGRERAVARRHEIGHERLKRRPLDVDPGVQHDDRANQAGDAERRGRGEQRHAGRRPARSPERTIGRRPRPRRAGAVRGRAGPGHEQEQQHVVDRHDGADGGAMLAERVPHERRDERAEERSGDAGEESAQADEQQREVRRPRRCEASNWTAPPHPSRLASGSTALTSSGGHESGETCWTGYNRVGFESRIVWSAPRGQ